MRGITWDNFNYTPVILVIFLATALSFWHMPFGAKHFYQGPKRCEEEAAIAKGKDDIVNYSLGEL